MAQHKWLKVGAAAILSTGILAACGSDEDEPQMEQETDVLPGNDDLEEEDPDVELDEEDDMEEDTED